MNRNEALKILELSEDASDDEIKKQFKKLAVKYHPDRNKDADAESKFKEINAAHTFLTEKQKEPKPGPGFYRQDVEDFFQHFRRQRRVRKPFIVSPLNIDLHLTFKESVKGCKRKITFSRYDECTRCEGAGGVQSISHKCTKCDGKGSKTEVSSGANGGAFFTVTHECDKCGGTGKEFTPCEICKGVGATLVEKSLEVQIPGAVKDGQVIRLAGQGHWQILPNFSGYTDAFLHARVSADLEMRLEGSDVISRLDLDLLTALKGGSQKIRTVDFDLDVTIPKGSRHKDKIYLAGHGAISNGEIGAHIVELNVKYPDDIDGLIERMEKE